MDKREEENIFKILSNILFGQGGVKDYPRQFMATYGNIGNELVKGVLGPQADLTQTIGLKLPEPQGPIEEALANYGGMAARLGGAMAPVGTFSKVAGLGTAAVQGLAPVAKEAIVRGATGLASGLQQNVGAAITGEKSVKDAALDTVSTTASTILSQLAERGIPKGVLNLLGQVSVDSLLNVASDIPTNRLPPPGSGEDVWRNYIVEKGIQAVPGAYFAGKSSFDGMPAKQKPIPKVSGAPTTAISPGAGSFLKELSAVLPKQELSAPAPKQEPRFDVSKFVENTAGIDTKLLDQQAKEIKPDVVKNEVIVARGKKLADDPNYKVKTLTEEEIIAPAIEDVGIAFKAIDDAVNGDAKTFADLFVASKTRGTQKGFSLQAQKIVKAIRENGYPANTPEEKIAGAKIFTEFANKLDKVDKTIQDFVKRGEDYGLKTKEDYINPKNREKLTSLYREFFKPKASEWADLYRYFNLLSSPKSLITQNMGSNLVSIGPFATAEKAVAGGVDFIKSKLNPQRPRTQFAGEAGAYAKALTSGAVIKNALSEAGKAFTGNKMTDLSMDEPITRNIPLTTVKDPKILRGIENVLRVPQKFLTAGDVGPVTAARSGEEAALLYRASKGVPVENLREQSVKGSRESTFNEELSKPTGGVIARSLGGFMDGINSLKSKGGIGGFLTKHIWPFTKIPTNITTRGIQYTPAGIIDILTTKSPMEQNKLISRLIIGGGIMGATAALFENGEVHGGLSGDDETAKLQRQAGIQPWSVDVKLPNGKYVNVQFQYLPPQIAYPMSMVVIVKQMLKNKTIGISDAENILNAVTDAVVWPFKTSTLKQMDDLFNLFTGKNISGDVSKLISTVAGQYAPAKALMGWVNRIYDENIRSQEKPDGTMVGGVKRFGKAFTRNYPEFLLPEQLKKEPEATTIYNRKKMSTPDVRVTKIPKTERVINALSIANVQLPTKQRTEARNLLDFIDSIKKIDNLKSGVKKKLESGQNLKNIVSIIDKTIKSTGMVSSEVRMDTIADIREDLTGPDGVNARLKEQDRNNQDDNGMPFKNKSAKKTYNEAEKKAIIDDFMKNLSGLIDEKLKFNEDELKNIRSGAYKKSIEYR